MHKYKDLILIISALILLTGCNVDTNNPAGNNTVAHNDTFIRIDDNNSNNASYEHVSALPDDIEEFTENIQDIEVVPGIDYSEHLYEISDMQSDNINTDVLTDMEFPYELSEVDEEDVKNLIKAIYTEENASDLEVIYKYIDDTLYAGEDYSPSVTYVVKIDEYNHIITYKDGVASSIKDVDNLYEMSLTLD